MSIRNIPLTRPNLMGNERRYVTECVESSWISSQGTFVQEFEGSLREFLRANYVVTTSSGTAALHLALAALGVGPGDEVLVPDLTFGATANAVIHCGATPVFIDISAETWTLDPKLINERITSRTRAIIPVHLYGHPCDMTPIIDIAAQHRLFLVEDCAQALGAEYQGTKVGTLGDVGCFSFFANKIITTGEGGACITNHHWLDSRLRLLRDHGMAKEKRYWHLRPGFNYRMTNLQAAIGVAQLERIAAQLEHRTRVGNRYRARLGSIPGLTMPPAMPWAKCVCWLFTVLVDSSVFGVDRDELARRLGCDGIETRPIFYPLHRQPAYGQEGTGSTGYPQTELVSAAGLSLPMPFADHYAVDLVCDAVAELA